MISMIYLFLEVSLCRHRWSPIVQCIAHQNYTHMREQESVPHSNNPRVRCGSFELSSCSLKVYRSDPVDIH